MAQSVYLESSLVDLKPRLLDFLFKMVNKAKEIKDLAFSVKKAELAELAGKDIRTVSRYLNTLQDSNIIQVKSKRGRSGGTVILLNSDMIRFDTSEKAMVNTDDPKSIDDVFKQKMPEPKPEPPKKKKRNRRTKQQMLEDQLLKSEKQKKAEALNAELLNTLHPDWDWFEKTDDPTGNLRTYIITRLYNRYAGLFPALHNAEVHVYKHEQKPVNEISPDYDVLPQQFYGTQRWEQFSKFRKFLEENNIDPAVYLSAQFSRSIFNSQSKQNKKILPFVNALYSDTAYDVYLQYTDYANKHSQLYIMTKRTPAKYADDYVVQLLREVYDHPESRYGMLEIKSRIKDYFGDNHIGKKERKLAQFYNMISADLRAKKVSVKSRDTLKKYLMTQILMQSGGSAYLPKYLILGSEVTRAVGMTINAAIQDRSSATSVRAKILGAMVLPNISEDQQISQGNLFDFQTRLLDETPMLVSSLLKYKNLYVSIRDIRDALQEYGREKIPVDDLSMLDIDKVMEFMDNLPYEQREQLGILEEEDLDMKAITQEKSWVLEGAVAEEDDPFVALFNKEREEGTL